MDRLVLLGDQSDIRRKALCGRAHQRSVQFFGEEQLKDETQQCYNVVLSLCNSSYKKFNENHKISLTKATSYTTPSFSRGPCTQM